MNKDNDDKALKELEYVMGITLEALEIGKRKMAGTSTPEDYMRLLEIKSWVDSEKERYGI